MRIIGVVTHRFIGIFLLVLAVALGFGLFEFARPGKVVILRELPMLANAENEEELLERRLDSAEERSHNIKALYMTGVVASDQGRAATHLRNEIMRIIDETEVNGLVIDVKETKGSEVTASLKPFIEEMKSKGVWTIARIATFRDNSQTIAHPEFYIKTKDGKIWRDNKGNAWLDPMNLGARLYLIQFSKEIADIGFDELQYDYIRFPSDGNMFSIKYADYNPALMTKPAALRDFFAFIHENMKAYKPEIMLSADLFGYVAITLEDLGIGQRLEDIGTYFDFVSPMIYPSHFYSGFYVPADPERGLPAVSLSYKGKDITQLVSNRPYDVIFRSLLMAEDIMSGRHLATSSKNLNEPGSENSTGESTDSPSENQSNFYYPARPHAKLRPWLQDFDLGADTSRGIVYGEKEVRDQIDAAERAGADGWILWSPTNTYTEAALRRE